MADLKELCIARLARTVVADVNADVPTRNVLYTVPPGKRAIITQVILFNPTATLAGMNDVDFGGGATATSPAWLNNETGIGDMTDVEDYMILRSDSDEYIAVDGDDATVADRDFVMYVVSGATGAAGVTADVYGFLIDS